MLLVLATSLSAPLPTPRPPPPPQVVSELSEYVGGVDAELARQAVRAIGEIAVRVPPAAELGEWRRRRRPAGWKARRFFVTKGAAGCLADRSLRGTARRLCCGCRSDRSHQRCCRSRSRTSSISPPLASTFPSSFSRPRPYPAVVESLLEALEMEAEYVRAETVVVMQVRVCPLTAPNCCCSTCGCCCRRRVHRLQCHSAILRLISTSAPHAPDTPTLPRTTLLFPFPRRTSCASTRTAPAA
jgi:hypothetical protein